LLVSVHFAFHALEAADPSPIQNRVVTMPVFHGWVVLGGFVKVIKAMPLVEFVVLAGDGAFCGGVSGGCAAALGSNSMILALKSSNRWMTSDDSHWGSDS
jgi:hypothetical protein